MNRVTFLTANTPYFRIPKTENNRNVCAKLVKEGQIWFELDEKIIRVNVKRNANFYEIKDMFEDFQ